MPSAIPSAAPPHFAPRPAPLGRTLLLVLLTAGGSYGLTQTMEGGGWSDCYVGRLRAESAALIADRAARIEQVLVRPGDQVQFEQPVLMLADDGLAERVEQQKLRTTDLEVAYEQARARAEVDLAWRLKELEAEILETQLRSAGFLKEQFEQQVEGVAWREFARRGSGMTDEQIGPAAFQPVFYEGGSPDEIRVRAMLRHEAAVSAAEASAAKIKLCEQRLAELDQLKRDLPDRVRRAAGVDVAELRLRRAQAELAALQQQRDRLTLFSPAFGVVGEFQKRPGDAVAPGEKIVTILDRDRRFLTVDVPSRSIHKFAPETAVALRFPDGLERAGRVRHVAPHTTMDETGGGDVPVRVRIERVGKLWPQAPFGTAVEVVPRN